MSPNWSVCRTIWHHAVLGERKAWVLAWTLVALALFALGAVLSFAVLHDAPRARIIICAVPLASLSMLYWSRYVPGAVKQNSPANARLVPGLHRSVRRTTLLAFGLTMAPLALLACAFDFPLLGFVALCVLFTGIGMARGGRIAGSVIYSLVIIAYVLVGSSPGLERWLASAPVLALLALLAAALAWDGMRTVFPAGGERHWKLLQAQTGQRISSDVHLSMKHKRASGHRARWYGLQLQRDLRPGADARHLLLHALGPHNHRFDFVLPLTAALACALTVKLYIIGSDAGIMNRFARDIVGCAAVPWILLQTLTFHRMVVSMDNTPGEQALVRLAPRAPGSDQLGRSLARQLLGICLVEVLVSSLAVAAMVALFGGGMQQLLVPASAMCASLAASGWVLRDYSGQRPGVLAVVCVQTLLVGGGFIALLLVKQRLPLWSALALLMLGCAAAIVHGRWKTMVEAPVPFPAGRFG